MPVVGVDSPVTVGGRIHRRSQRRGAISRVATARFTRVNAARSYGLDHRRGRDGKRQACAEGHFFVVLADKDQVFFEYQEKREGANERLLTWR